uniref:ATP synthase subunit n=2 Tax=Sus scrofa TaxID=9823 RepID=A0A8D1RND1_PIG
GIQSFPTVWLKAPSQTSSLHITFWCYAKVQLVPPTPAEIPTAIQSLNKSQYAQTGSFKQLTVKEALLNGLLTTEVLMWFSAGEITGKNGIVGYDV